MKLVFQTTFEGAHLSWLTVDVLDLATGADSDFEESATPAKIHKYKCYSADPRLQKDSISIFRYFHSITEAYESFFFLKLRIKDIYFSFISFKRMKKEKKE